MPYHDVINFVGGAYSPEVQEAQSQLRRLKYHQYKVRLVVHINYDGVASYRHIPPLSHS